MQAIERKWHLKIISQFAALLLQSIALAYHTTALAKLSFAAKKLSKFQTTIICTPRSPKTVALNQSGQPVENKNAPSINLCPTCTAVSPAVPPARSKCEGHRYAYSEPLASADFELHRSSLQSTKNSRGPPSKDKA